MEVFESILRAVCFPSAVLSLVLFIILLIVRRLKKSGKIPQKVLSWAFAVCLCIFELSFTLLMLIFDKIDGRQDYRILVGSYLMAGFALSFVSGEPLIDPNAIKRHGHGPPHI